MPCMLKNECTCNVHVLVHDPPKVYFTSRCLYKALEIRKHWYNLSISQRIIPVTCAYNTRISTRRWGLASPINTPAIQAAGLAGMAGGVPYRHRSLMEALGLPWCMPDTRVGSQSKRESRQGRRSTRQPALTSYTSVPRFPLTHVYACLGAWLEVLHEWTFMSENSV